VGYLEDGLSRGRVSGGFFLFFGTRGNGLADAGDRSPRDITERLDRLIADMRARFHEGNMNGEKGRGDVLVVAHGHILRAFAMRWIGKELHEGVALLLEGMCGPESAGQGELTWSSGWSGNVEVFGAMGL
jgi:hypothetical protein